MHRSGSVILGSLIVILLLISCKKQDDFSSIGIIGHGGNGLDNVNTLYHDNSLESIELALLTDGCDGIELDVQLSADHTLWLYHDPTLDSETNGAGCVASQSDADISTLRYSSINHEELIRLTDLPRAYLAYKKVMIDARSIDQCTNAPIDLSSFVNELIVFRTSCPSSTQIIVGTNNVSWISTFSVAGFETMAEITSMGQFNELILAAPGIDYVVARNTTISSEDVSLIQNSGRKVVIYEVRSPKSIRNAMQKRPALIMTDNIRTTVIEKY